MVPRPVATGQTKLNSSILVTEFLNTLSLNNKSWADLGSQLADLHLHNFQGNHSVVSKFGFHVDTYVESLPQNNTWINDWIV